MHVWTTPQLQDLFLDNGLPIKLREKGEIKDSFLADASPGDIAVLGMDEDYLEFHDAVKERSHACRLLFISHRPVLLKRERALTNAVILDAERLRTAEIKKIILFILDLALLRPSRYAPDDCFESENVNNNNNNNNNKEDRPLDDPVKVKELITHLIKNKRPVVMVFEIREKGQPVMARGVCNIKEMRDGILVFHNFRHSLFLKGLRRGISVEVFFPYKNENKAAHATIQDVMDREIGTSIPESLLPARDIRIQPNADNPISLFVLIPNEPTINYQVVDISPRGIGFLCTRDLPVGVRFSFAIMLPHPRRPSWLPRGSYGTGGSARTVISTGRRSCRIPGTPTVLQPM